MSIFSLFILKTNNMIILKTILEFLLYTAFIIFVSLAIIAMLYFFVYMPISDWYQKRRR